VIKEGEALLKKTKNSEELFKYTLWWLTNNAGSSKVMGMDAVYVYFVENYHMKGLATWLSDEDLKKHIDNARKIAPNVIGNLAPDLNMRDTANRDLPLSSVKSKYTLLVFWSPDCGHCKDEMPKLDSVYRAVLKNKGVKIYAVTTLNDEKMWKDFIKEKKLQDWIHVWDPEVRTNFRDKYNVYMTPILYLLDEKKIIKGKRIDYTNIAGLLEFLEQ
jgi:thiol-disulfide isomerase/thioredoxin